MSSKFIMEETEKWVIHRTRDAIIQDLQPKYILKELLDLGVITGTQGNEILSNVTEEKQVETLLNYVETGGSEAYNNFKKSLKTDGKYFWLATIMDSTYKELANTNFCNLSNVLIRGGVPSLVPNSIQRKILLKLLRDKLMDLGSKDAGWVTIHGMGGYGKTMLAAEAVRDLLLIHNVFPHGVFWIKIGRNISEDVLMNKMHYLCEKLDSAAFCGKLPCDVEMAAERLRTLFGSNNYNRCLIVLDDVWSELAIRNFDLGCRVMVTTRDRGVMDVATTDVLYVELRDGFTLDETKQLFAKSHKMTVEQLPVCVSEIWQTAQGYPFVMAIINSKVGEHSNSTNIDEAFKMCLQKLQNRSLIKTTNRMPYSDYKCVTQALEMSVETLGDLKDYYFDLAIFPDDCYIGREILGVLWQMEKWDVEEIMNTFSEKALAMQVPNGHHTTYYTIHDMYLQYMCDTLGDKIQERHKRFVYTYLEKYDGQFHKLPADGYILLYIGYHLQNGKMFDKFPEVFLDLKFVFTKLAATGPADLLGDFHRYRKHIVQDKKYLKELTDFEEFVRSSSHLLTNPVYDMLQVALSQSPTSEVFQRAVKICNENPQNYYFIWCNRDKSTNPCILSTRLHPYDTVCICILPDQQHIVSGGSDGLIKMWDRSSGKVKLVLKGHNQRITCLKSYKSNKKIIIVSSSEDHTVRVWLISREDFYKKKKNKVNTMNSCLTEFRDHKAAVRSCSVYSPGGQVASCDEKGTLQIWKAESGDVVSTLAISHNICSNSDCEFSVDGTRIVTMTDCVLSMWDFKKQIPIWEIKVKSGNFSSCFISPLGNEVLVTYNSNVEIYDFESGGNLGIFTDPRGKFLRCCCISSDGEYISAGNIENAVVVWDKKQRKAIDYLHGHKEGIHDVLFMPFGSNGDSDGIRLVSSADDGTVMIWRTAYPTKESDAILKDIYFVRFDEYNQPVIAVSDMNNLIHVTDANQEIISGEVISPKQNFSITCCVLSHKRDNVLFGSTTGHIQIFSVESGTTSKIGKLQKDITCCAFSADDVQMAAGTIDGFVLIFSMENGEKSTCGQMSFISNISFFCDDLKLLSCSHDGRLVAWNVSDGSLAFNCVGHSDSVVNSDVIGRLIVSASTDKTFRIWNGETGMCLYSSLSHSACVRCVRFNSEANLLLSGDDSGTVRLWSVSKILFNRTNGIQNGSAAGELVILLRVINVCVTESWICDIQFSADSLKFVVCSDSIDWWSTDAVMTNEYNLKPLQTFPIRGRKTGKIFCSDNFETFITVDDTGVLYCLRLLTTTDEV
ncbi:wD repeat domain [Chamberlinius hualienensis]